LSQCASLDFHIAAILSETQFVIIYNSLVLEQIGSQ
jgi:hypothetical protein